MTTRREFIATAAAATASAPFVLVAQSPASMTERAEPPTASSAGDPELARYNTLVGLAQSVPLPED